MAVAADVAPRLSGLLPLWMVPDAAILWLVVFWLAARPLRKRFHSLYLDVAAVGGLLLANLLFFWRPLLSASQIPRGGGDFNSFYFPLDAFSAHAVQTGEFPLWNPRLFGGMPQLANYQSAMLYPPNLIAWTLHRPFSYGTLEMLAIGHFFIASLGAYFLSRSLGMRRLPAVTVGIIFSACGFLTAHLGHYTMLSVAVWLPLLLLCLRYTALTDSWLWSAATVLVVFLEATGGHQQLLLYSLTAGVVWWLYWLGERHQLWPWNGDGQDFEHIVAATRDRARAIAWAVVRGGGAFVVGLGLAAPAILPSLQLASLSVRSGLSYEQATEFSVEPVALLQFLLPKAFGSNPTDYWGAFSSGEVWGYVGIVTLVLAAIGLATRPSGVRLLLAAFAGVALLFALGPFTPLHGWVFRFVPPYNLIRAPARGYLFVDLSLALLAGFGVQEIAFSVAESERVRYVLHQSKRWLLIALAALMLVIIPLFYSQILGVNDPSNRPIIAVDGLDLAVIYLLGTAALLWAAASGRIKGAIVCLLAVVLVVLDLYGATASFNPGTDDLTAGYRHPQAVAFLQQMRQSGPFRIASSTLAWQPDLASVAGLDDAVGLFDPMQPAAYKKVADVLSGGNDPTLYNLLNVRYLITDTKAKAPSDAFEPVLKTDDGLVIWENHDVMPRVRLSYVGQQISVDDALAAVTSPGFNPVSTVYLSGKIAPAQPGGSGTARIDEYLNDRVSIHVQTDRPVYLILADSAYPGWNATIDGTATSVATADGIFRAITVPAGTHEIVFRFDPPIVAKGWIVAGVSLLALLVILAAGVFQWHRTRRRIGINRARDRALGRDSYHAAS
jgi:hypothetical protein